MGRPGDEALPSGPEVPGLPGPQLSGLPRPDVPGLPVRFTVENLLGAGGFGSVYVVLDRERNTRLALKKLERVDPSSLYRFKQEFRALAHLRHPNLVPLFELLNAGGTWCFTMELVEGTRFDRWVRGDAGAARDLSFGSTESKSTSGKPASATGGSSDAPGSTDNATGSAAHASVRRGTSQVTTALDVVAAPEPGRPFDELRLRTGLRGLVAGVVALHAAGLLHRDLKPSNVLVRADGRVAILDFGLVATGVVDAHQSIDSVAGTPAYMSPEQAAGAPLTAASDLYAIGLMLYEALAGQPPFAGTPADIFSARASRDPRDPRALRAGLPDDLCELCLRLLARDPLARPSGVEVARQLGLGVESARATDLGHFVGRKDELVALEAAHASVRTGRLMTVHLSGPPGVGKSALVRRFLGRFSDGQTVVLSGRCYERESVPYKALDPIVDALGRYLKRLPRIEAAGLLPRDGRALVRLFPTLGQLELWNVVSGREPVPDPHELRRRAFGALRELLARLTDSRGLVISIDDAQWGDADSAALLEAVFSPPDPPPALLIFSYRASATGNLPEVLRRSAPGTAPRATLDLALRPLPPEDALALARAALGVEGGSEADAIAHESGGSPLFIGHLARAVFSGRRAGDVSLQQVLASRLGRLEPDARLVLELLACAGRPLTEANLSALCDLGPGRLPGAIELLREESLVTVAAASAASAASTAPLEAPSDSLIEILHEEVAAAARAALSPEASRRHHGRLAAWLEATEGADPEALTEHLTAAGEPVRASVYAERAGDRAAQALAFAHAARWYRRALDAGSPDAGRVEGKLAEALANAGRGSEAAARFMACAERSTGIPALELRRRGAHQLLRAGRIREGLAAVAPVLTEANIRMQPTPRAALLGLLWRRFGLKVRGLASTERTPAQIDERDLRRIDLCWSLSTGLIGVDVIRSADFQARNLRLALDAGEPLRLARALALQAVLSTLENHTGVARARVLQARAAELAERIGNPEALAWTQSARAIIAWSDGALAACAANCDQSIATFRDRCRDAFREMGSLETWFNLHARFLMGQIETVALRASACVAEARARGDLYTESTARTYVMPLVWLAVDRPEDAREEATQAIAAWGDAAFHHQHWAALRAQCSVDLYEGRGAEAVKRIDAARNGLRTSLVLRVRTPRLEYTYLEGRALLEVAWGAAGPDRLPRILRAAARLEAERNRLADVYALALRAGVAARVAGGKSAREAFAHAEAAFNEMQMPLHTAAALRRQGELVGGREGKRLLDRADERLTGAGVVAPDRFTNFLMPRAV